ncbi:DUF1624 domain-containing protein [Segetibacter koreensis]|uniref:DUF1624 domain-containing protein n=1 Tax=Segetibacter koreensis TaxID=398037 RepID=UPI000379BC6B|nr:heparan-alpha-glucosaminide N-acetyltransferase domain-containing protein [Segetibacter koreensis]
MVTAAIPKKRILSVDVLRGLVMIVMALDHVRDFFHISAQTADPLDLGTTTPILFFTRWITHFCAPTFVFLSGVSAYLSAENKTLQTVSSFLMKRGLWLVIVDLVLISFALTFNPSYNLVMLTVFWAIGCSMIFLGLILKITPKLVLPLGLLIFISHDLVSAANIPAGGTAEFALKVLFTGIYVIPVTPSHFIGFFYAIVPWSGVMFLGYGLGNHIRNRKTLFILGISLLLLFFLLRFINQYGEPKPWQLQGNFLNTILSFVNTTKYPPSLQFLSMTLGVALLLLACIPNSSSRFNKIISVYGRVPFFYFVMHLFLAHLLLVGAFFITGHTTQEIRDTASPILFRPRDFGFSLPIVYLVWISVVLVLYYPCKWFYKYKVNSKKWWLRYL